MKSMKNNLMLAFTSKKLINIKSQPITNEILNDKNIQIIDIRTPAEWEDGSINGAIKVMFIDEFGLVNQKFLDEFNTKTDSLKTRALLCKSGYRSYFCARFLTISGYKNIINLSGGIVEYNDKFGV